MLFPISSCGRGGLGAAAKESSVQIELLWEGVAGASSRFHTT